MHSEPKRLPSTRPPRPDESLRGYLLALAIQNGYPSLASLLTIVDSHKSRPSTFDTFDLGPLAELTAQPEESLRNLVYRPNKNSSRIFLGQPIPAFLIASDRLKFCPSCIEETLSFKAIWDLQLSVVCPDHGTYLVSECEECKRPISWFGTPWYQCKCKQDLRNTPVKVADPDVILFSRYLLLAFAPFSSPLGGQLPTELGGIAPGSLHWIVAMVGCWANGDVKGKISQRLELLSAEQRIKTLVSAKAVFTDWPSNFHAFLARSRGLSPQPKATTLMQREFGALYQTIMSDIKDPNCEFIRVQLRSFGESLSLQEKIAVTDGIKVHGLAKQLGIGVSATRKMAERGEFSLLKEKRGYQKDKLVITEVDAKNLGETLSDKVSLQEFSEILGLGIKITASLRDEGFFTADNKKITDGRCNVMYSRKEAEGLLSSFAAKVLSCENLADERYQKITDALRIYCINGLSRADLLNAVLSGSIRIFASAVFLGIGEAYVDRREARKFVVQAINHDLDFLHQESASEEFNISEARLVHLAKRGSIVSKIMKHGARKYRLLSRKSIESWIAGMGRELHARQL